MTVEQAKQKLLTWVSAQVGTREGEIKMFSGQVFVADNIKEVIPEFLMLLKGCIDCPDLPLNVSRSFLQNDGYVKKMSNYITRKVADRLVSEFNTKRADYEKYWDDIHPFVKYGCVRDEKFYERVKGSLLLTLTDGSHVTLAEYLDSAKEKHEGTVYYSTNKTAQAQYISMLEREGVKCAVLDKMIDAQFITMLEHENENVKFKRVDSDLSDLTGEKTEGEENERMTSLFRRVSGDEKLNVKCTTLKDETIPAVLTIDEEARRFDDMMKMYRAAGEQLPEGMAPTLTLTLNLACPTVKSLDCEAGEREELIARQIYMLSILSQRGLSGEELERFLSDSYEMLKRI